MENKPSNNPILQFYCGYVESLCEKYNDKSLSEEYQMMVTESEEERQRLYKSTDKSKPYEWRILYAKHHPISKENHTLKTLRKADPYVWLYALLKHIINYDILNDSTKKYIDKWINRLTLTDILYPLFCVPNKEIMVQKLMDSINRHYYIIETLKPLLMDIDKGCPIRRAPIDNDLRDPPYEPIQGTGCYIQTYEGRLAQWYSVKVTLEWKSTYYTDIMDIPPKLLKDANIVHEYYDDYPNHQAIRFIDKFKRDIYNPLLRSNVKRIIINIDRKRENSNDALIDSFRDELINAMNGYSDKCVSLIVPDEHIHAAVGRNLIWGYIRLHIEENGLYWFGSDDDDRINTEGVNTLNDYIMENLSNDDPPNFKKIILFDPSFATKDVNRKQPGYKHYAPWTYAISPSYYDGLSFPCAPVEKEDLDVFNRLMQHTENIVNLMKIEPYASRLKANPLYIYTSDRILKEKLTMNYTLLQI